VGSKLKCARESVQGVVGFLHDLQDTHQIIQQDTAMGKFSLTTTLPCSAATLREYLSDPGNLPSITDPEVELEVAAAPAVATEGEEIEFSILACGLRQRMRHRWVTVTDSLIVVEQVDGPTRSWRHEQEIRTCAEGCALTDRYLFEPPGGMMGRIVTEEAITEMLTDSTALRHELLAEMLTKELA